MKNVMKNAWKLAKEAAIKFGGKAADYISQALKQAWAEIKKGVVENVMITNKTNKKEAVAELYATTSYGEKWCVKFVDALVWAANKFDGEIEITEKLLEDLLHSSNRFTTAKNAIK